MAAPPVELYVDRMSQPSRTVLLFCEAAGVPYEERRVAVGRGEQRKPEFLAINPAGKVPAMRDGAFCTGESGAIMRYLCDTRGAAVADHWYPRDPQARARVNAVLDWHGSSLRVGSMTVCWHRAIVLNLNLPGNERLVKDYGLPTLKTALNTLDTVWLRGGAPYVGGQTRPSIADLLLICEIEQLCLLDGAEKGPDMAALLAPHPRIAAWMARVRSACGPQRYDGVHALVRKSRDRLVVRRQQAGGGGGGGGPASKL